MTLYYRDDYKDLSNTYTVYAVAPADRKRFERAFPDAYRIDRTEAIRLGWTRVREAKKDGEYWPAGFHGEPFTTYPSTIDEAIEACRVATRDAIDNIESTREAAATFYA